jgi:predicted RNase H-like HicB family nuclease
MQYLIIYEKSKTGYSAHVPDLPIVLCSGKTFEECRDLVHEGIRLHILWLKEDGLPVPQPRNDRAELFEIAA